MLFGFLLTIFIFVCFLLILIILVQQGRGGLGLGALGGGAQMLFGGSGGQDIFQKITWILGTMFMVGSFVLFVLGSKQGAQSRYVANQTTPMRRQVPMQGLPEKAKVPVTPEAPAQ